MNERLRAALVIARRDYVASVWSKSFILFLIGPLLPVIAGMFFGGVGASIDRKATHPTVAVIAPAADAALIRTAQARLAGQLGRDRLPELSFVEPAPDEDAQARALLADPARNMVAVLRSPLIKPTLTGPRAQLWRTRGDIGMILDTARTLRTLRGSALVPPAETKIALQVAEQSAGNDSSARLITARIGQLALMMLTMILSGMLLSNLIEEKSNKVIEVLAAAVPVDAIFLGKLVAMLAMSLTGIAVWGSLVALGLSQLPLAGEIPAPAVGWGGFALLGLIYFTALYLLLGALFLGIGGHAASVREVQTLSLPVTMLQIGVVAFASTAVADMNGAMGIAAAVFPWSSPFAMLARAAQTPELWPHLIAIVWQALWVGLIIKVAAAHFRRSVLKSGPRQGRRWFGRRAAMA